MVTSHNLGTGEDETGWEWGRKSIINSTVERCWGHDAPLCGGVVHRTGGDQGALGVKAQADNLRQVAPQRVEAVTGFRVPHFAGLVERPSDDPIPGQSAQESRTFETPGLLKGFDHAKNGLKPSDPNQQQGEAWDIQAQIQLTATSKKIVRRSRALCNHEKS